MKKIIQLLVVVLLFCPPVAMANTDAIIQGVTDFLIERAKQNHLYIFEKKLQANADFATYFPHTYSYVADGDLRILLTSKSIWQRAVQDDLDTLVTRTFAQSVNRQIDLVRAANVGMDRYIDLVRYLEIEADGQVLSLNQVPIDASEQIKKLINGFWTKPVALRDRLIELGRMLAAYSDVATVPKTTSAELLVKTKELLQAFKELDGLWQHIENNRDRLRVDAAALQQRCAVEPEFYFCRESEAAGVRLQALLGKTKDSLDDTIAKSGVLISYLQEIPRLETMTEKAIASMRLLKKLGLDKTIAIDKLKRHLLFFAQLSDADNKEDVKAILTEYTLPAVSFLLKREEGANRIMLSSYLGYAYGRSFDTRGDDNTNEQGIIAPIGLEFSHGLKNGSSLSLLLAPVDLGYPVTLKLNGIEDKLSFSDIFAPGAYLAYGVRDLPINLGVAYQRGRKIAASNAVENRVLLFISYDMPLFSLY